MFGVANLNNISNLATAESLRAWYESPAYALNSVLPSFIHDYANNRYYNTTNGATGFPFENTRTTNAMMFNSDGDLVWAPVNMLARSTPTSGTQWGIIAATATDGYEDNFGGTEGVNLVANLGISTILNDSNACARLTPNLTVNSGGYYCFVFYAKANDLTGVRVREPVSTGARALISLIDGSVTTENGTTNNSVTGINITTFAEADGWWKIKVTRKATASTFNMDIKPGIDIGDGVSGVFIANVMVHPYDGTDKLFIKTTGSAYYGHRLDYNPATLAPRGYLIETQRTNLMPISTGTPANWTGNFSSITSSATQFWGFDGLTITTNSTAGSQFSYFTTAPGALSASTRYTSSMYFRRGNVPRIQLSVTNNVGIPEGGDWAYANYNFDTGVLNVFGTPTANVSGSRRALSNGIVHIQISYTTSTTPSSGAGVLISFVDSDTAGRLSGTTVLGASVNCFGAQLEAGNFATSHIPTFGVTATRAGDVADLTTPPPYSSSGTTYYATFEREGTPQNSTSESSSGLWFFGQNGVTQISAPFGYGTSNQIRVDLVNGGVQQAAISGFNTPFSIQKLCARFAPNNARGAYDGALTSLDTSVSMPASLPTTVQAIGRREGATHQMHGWLRELRIYETAVPDGELITATT